MKIIKNKKGELTTQQIVMLIILVTSFAIILFFFFRLDLGEISNKEICHNSVILKGKANFLQKVTGSGALDCRTNYLCISGGGECEGITPTITKEINLKDDVDDKDEIMKAIAEEMVDCWWMFGEGKVNYGDIGTDNAIGKTTCAVCSIVKFDSKLQEKYSEGISYEDFIEKGLIKPKDDQVTYLKYIYGVFTIEELYEKFEEIKEDVDSNSISFKEKYTIRTGIIKGALFGSTGISPNRLIHPYFFNSENSPKTECGEFITKA